MAKIEIRYLYMLTGNTPPDHKKITKNAHTTPGQALVQLPCFRCSWLDSSVAHFNSRSPPTRHLWVECIVAINTKLVWLSKIIFLILTKWSEKWVKGATTSLTPFLSRLLHIHVCFYILKQKYSDNTRHPLLAVYYLKSCCAN